MDYRQIFLPSILSTSMLIAGTAFAESTDSIKREKRLPEVEVKAKAKVELTPLNVTTISDEQINRSAETSLLPVMTMDIPGFFSSERGFAGYGVSGGAAGSVSIRGVGGGNKVLFMIDGMPQWAGIFGHSLPDTYVANGVERIEVVKGPSSLLYGSSAMGGSVNIITRSQREDGVSGRARAMFGSFNTQKFNLSTGVKKARFRLPLQVSLTVATAIAKTPHSGWQTNTSIYPTASPSIGKSAV